MKCLLRAIIALSLCCVATPHVCAQNSDFNQNSREENSFRFAILAAEPAIRAEMLERFVQNYPYSYRVEGALESLCSTYQGLKDTQHMKYAAQRLLGANPNNLTGLATMAYCVHAEAAAAAPYAGGQMQEAGQFGARCLQALWSAPKPAGSTDEQWSTLRNQYQSACQRAVSDAQANPGPGGSPQPTGYMQPAYQQQGYPQQNYSQPVNQQQYGGQNNYYQQQQAAQQAAAQQAAAQAAAQQAAQQAAEQAAAEQEAAKQAAEEEAARQAAITACQAQCEGTHTACTQAQSDHVGNAVASGIIGALFHSRIDVAVAAVDAAGTAASSACNDAQATCNAACIGPAPE